LLHDVNQWFTRAAAIPRAKGGARLQMKLAYNHWAPLFFFLLQRIDCSYFCPIPIHLNFFHVYMVRVLFLVCWFLEDSLQCASNADANGNYKPWNLFIYWVLESSGLRLSSQIFAAYEVRILFKQHMHYASFSLFFFFSLILLDCFEIKCNTLPQIPARNVDVEM
jgi:hypothetical protein